MLDIDKLDWVKAENLIPVIIQDSNSLQVLMLGYMNQEALAQTLTSNKVTFYSRTKQRLWVKGETSGNFLQVVDIASDCDNDALLITVNPVGDTCHLEKPSCFGADEAPGIGIIAKLNQTIAQRYQNRAENSYTSKLFNAGTQRIAQKVGEEGVETALAAMSQDKQQITAESSDLLYHLLVLLRQTQVDFSAVLAELRQRHQRTIDKV